MPFLEHQSVDRAGTPGRFVDDVADFEGGNLVRDSDIDPGKARQHQAPHGRWKIVRMDGQRQIRAVYPVSLQPKAVQPGRSGVTDRPASNARESRPAR